MTEHNEVPLSQSEIAILQREVLDPALKAREEQQKAQEKASLIEKEEIRRQQEHQMVQNRIKEAEEFIGDKTALTIFKKLYNLNDYDVAELAHDMKSDGFEGKQMSGYLNRLVEINDPRTYHSSKYEDNRSKFHRDFIKGLGKFEESKNQNDTTQEEQKVSQVAKPKIDSNAHPEKISLNGGSSKSRFGNPYSQRNKSTSYAEARVNSRKELDKWL